MLVWDEAKRAANLAKHRIDLSAAETFEWSSSVVFEDRRFDYGEVREVAWGYIGSRLHVLVFTRRGGATHVISLRKANDREFKRYAEARRQT